MQYKAVENLIHYFQHAAAFHFKFKTGCQRLKHSRNANAASLMQIVK